MEFTNSPLVIYSKITKNKSNRKLDGKTIKAEDLRYIAIHCTCSSSKHQSCKNTVDWFYRIGEDKSREASSNYVVGEDGVALSVDEKYRAWTTGGNKSYSGGFYGIMTGRIADYYGITIETVSDMSHPYAITDKTEDNLVSLVSDICKRYNKKRFEYINDAEKTLKTEVPSDTFRLVLHKWTANKSCPGADIESRLPRIVERVNTLLSENKNPAETVPEVSTRKLMAGDLVKIKETAVYYYNSNKKIPQWVKEQNWFVKSINTAGDRVVINENERKTNAICSPVHADDLTLAEKTKETIHTVVHGDTLWALAKRYLGDGRKYPQIKEWNKLTSNTIYTGMKLIVQK